jgi:hypothetical protein
MATLFKKKFMKVPDMHMGNAIREIARNAYVDWILILVISLMVAAGLIAGGLHLYWLISSGNFKGAASSATNSKKIFDEKQLNDVISFIKAKEDNTNLLKKGYSGPPDPSK